MAVRENCHYLGSVYSNLFETPTKETAIFRKNFVVSFFIYRNTQRVQVPQNV